MGIKHEVDASFRHTTVGRTAKYKALSTVARQRRRFLRNIFLSCGITKVPVHVTKQAGRKVNAERPPSNRQNASQPPRNGGEDGQPGDDNPNHPSGSGGGDGGGGGGDENGSGPAVLSNATVRTSRHQTSVWYCHDCEHGPFNLSLDSYCPNCQIARSPMCYIDCQPRDLSQNI
ncbi:hypothetical protein F5Y07DRAFT_376738 [Xylaria sp. FL0933]|nr:hypothetical protein F5Y07DRAFT_376738 [Xylaria sp. FL0933]